MLPLPHQVSHSSESHSAVQPRTNRHASVAFTGFLHGASLTPPTKTSVPGHNIPQDVDTLNPGPAVPCHLGAHTASS